MSSSFDRLVYWILERESIRKLKEAGASKPWTEDRILQQYKFCNVFREFDTVTKWIATNWRKPNKDDPLLWFAMAVARWVNWPETLEDLGYPVPWSKRNFIEVLNSRKQSGTKVWTGAYLIGTNGNKMSKIEYIANEVLTPLWKARTDITPIKNQRLSLLSDTIGEVKNQGRFMIGQIIADVKYSPRLRGAKDWWTFAVSGPGSRRGLNRLLGFTARKPWKEQMWKANLDQQLDLTLPEVSPVIGRLHAQDFQNCLCEFDKYERVRLGEGKPRSRYNGVG